jgi:hypothetical protein
LATCSDLATASSFHYRPWEWIDWGCKAIPVRQFGLFGKYFERFSFIKAFYTLGADLFVKPKGHYGQIGSFC